MTDKPPKRRVSQKPPAGARWTWHTAELIESDAWRGLGINERRLLDFLERENMAWSGQRNGELLAPHRDLIIFGISASAIAPCFNDLEERGLISRRRRDAYSPTVFALTWLTLSDGTGPTNEWRQFRDPTLSPLPPLATKKRPPRRATGSGGRKAKLRATGSGGRPATGSGGTGAHIAKNGSIENQDLTTPVPREVVALLRSSYQGGAGYSVSEGSSPTGAPEQKTEPTERSE